VFEADDCFDRLALMLTYAERPASLLRRAEDDARVGVRRLAGYYQPRLCRSRRRRVSPFCRRRSRNGTRT